MITLDSIINTGDPREIKRAMAVKMKLADINTQQIQEILSVSEQFVSKWKLVYERETAESLLLQYKGAESYLSPKEREEVIEYIQGQTTITTEGLRDHIEEKYGVSYLSKQSYYELLSEGEMSWHKTKKANPKKDLAKVIAKREAIKKS